MRKLLFLLWMPLAVFGSTVYTFSEQTARGTVGFTYTTPDYLSEPSVWISPWRYTACNISALPGWVCNDAILRESTLLNGQSTVSVVFNLIDLRTTGFGVTDQINESFPGATLTSDGTWSAFLSNANFTVHDPPDVVTANPEPSTWTLLTLGAVPGLLALYRRRAK
jgi:hypothetical protein